jgi:hypothetical protein
LDIKSEYRPVTLPNPKRQKVGWATLDRLFAEADNCWAIHYSCESFYDRPEGRSPRITSIAVRKVDTGQTLSFSIHQVAEERAMRFSEIETHYDQLEREMLDRFYTHVGSHRGMKYIHWNMRDINYGFAAIEHRYRVLGGDPVIIDDDKKVDLARLLTDIHGVGYAGHPRLERLLEINQIKPRDFMTGRQEAEAFEQRNFVGLHQSTLRKVDVIANILARAQDRNLKTNTTWWEMRGGRVRALWNLVAENRTVSLIASAASIGGLILTIWAFWH